MIILNKVIGMDASRSKSGGVVAYVIGILTSIDPREYGIKTVHLWAHNELIKQIPDYSWLVKHTPPILEKSILHQLFWQYYILPKELKKFNCDLLFNTCAGSICPYKLSVSISQDMLSFEAGEIQRYGISIERVRLIFLKYTQIAALKRSKGVIFANQYVKNTFETILGKLSISEVIPHGIHNKFHQIPISISSHSDTKKTLQILYVSNAAPYKHQWQVVKAIGLLRQQGLDVTLLLVGGGKGKAQKLLDKQRSRTDPNQEFITQLNFVPNEQIPKFLANADIFVFASSCENMPITLLEAMGSGLPIACSNRGPMPEVLQDAGLYFDPEDSDSIAQTLNLMIKNIELRDKLSKKSKSLSQLYSWDKSAKSTWNFIRNCVE